jgi:hypothetical protein
MDPQHWFRETFRQFSQPDIYFSLVPGPEEIPEVPVLGVLHDNQQRLPGWLSAEVGTTNLKISLDYYLSIL